MSLTIRLGNKKDFTSFYPLGNEQSWSEEKKNYFNQVFQHSICITAERENQVVGFAAMNYSLLGNAFVLVLQVREVDRRSGVGTALIRDLESKCRTKKLFTSTNQSNLPMRSLLNKLGYRESGILSHLVPSDSEVFYYRKVCS